MAGKAALPNADPEHTPRRRHDGLSGQLRGAGPKAAVDTSPLPMGGLRKAGGARVVGFLQRFVVIPKGTGARKPMKVRPWQRDLIAGAFDDPRPRFAMWSMPRGQGKSALAAALGLYALHADGVDDASVVVVAADERQAGIVFNSAVRMTELSEPLIERTQIFRDHLYVPGSGSTFQVLPAEAHRLEGLDPSMAIIDEIGVVDRRTYEVIASAMGKRSTSLTLMIGTPSVSRENSVMWDLRTAALTNGHDHSFVFVEFSAPMTDPVDCMHCWEMANPALGDLIAIDSMHALLPPKLREATFRRYRLGQWAEDSMHQWMAPELWAACAARDRDVDVEVQWVLGLDGSATADVTALVAVSVEDRPHIEVIAYWQPDDENPVPILDVEEAVRVACKERQVISIVCDPFRWQRSLQILLGEGFPVMEYPQQPARLTPATTSFYEAVANHQLTHDGSPELALHISHAIIKTDARGTRIVKEAKKSPRRIDLAMAAIMAHDRAKDLAGSELQFW
jgi:phage terminase large subunit-like protein